MLFKKLFTFILIEINQYSQAKGAGTFLTYSKYYIYNYDKKLKLNTKFVGANAYLLSHFP